MPRNKRKHPASRYERIMLAAINTLPFKFHSPGQPNIPKRPRRDDSFGERHTPKPANLQRLRSSPGPHFNPSSEHVKRQLSDRETTSRGPYQRIRAAEPNKEAMN